MAQEPDSTSVAETLSIASSVDSSAVLGQFLDLDEDGACPEPEISRTMTQSLPMSRRNNKNNNTKSQRDNSNQNIRDSQVNSYHSEKKQNSTQSINGEKMGLKLTKIQKLEAAASNSSKIAKKEAYNTEMQKYSQNSKEEEPNGQTGQQETGTITSTFIMPKARQQQQGGFGVFFKTGGFGKALKIDQNLLKKGQDFFKGFQDEKEFVMNKPKVLLQKKKPGLPAPVMQPASLTAFMGFQTARGNKVHIQEESILRFQKMFEEEFKTQSSQMFFKEKTDRLTEDWKVPGDLVLGFSTGGLKKNLAVSEESMNNARSMFREQPEKPQCMKKNQTKPKKQQLLINTGNKNQAEVQTNKASRFIKSETTEVPELKKAVKAKSNIKQPVANQNKPLKDLFKLSDRNHLQMKFDKLKDLPVRETRIQNFQEPSQFSHSPETCSLLGMCYFCINKHPSNTITKQDILAILKGRYNISEEYFSRNYSHITFKLQRYQQHYPEYINKRLHPSNVLSEIDRRYCGEVYSRKKSPIQRYLDKEIHPGTNMVLIVKSITYLQEFERYYVELSDGWYSLYAVIRAQKRSSAKNLLSNNNCREFSRLILKGYLYVGLKLQTAGWRAYPLKGILAFFDDTLNQSLCIQIFYNSTYPVTSNQKLGLCKKPLLRSLSLCKLNCGDLQYVQFQIIRKIFPQPSGSQQEQIPFFYLRVADICPNRSPLTYLLRIEGGESVSDQIGLKEFLELTNLRYTHEYRLEMTRHSIFNSFKDSKLKDLNYSRVLESLLVNHADQRKLIVGRPCDIILRVESVGGSILKGCTEDKTQYEVQLGLADRKKDLSGLTGKVVVIEELVVADERRLKFTGLSKIKQTTREPYYQKVIDSFNNPK